MYLLTEWRRYDKLISARNPLFTVKTRYMLTSKLSSPLPGSTSGISVSLADTLADFFVHNTSKRQPSLVSNAINIISTLLFSYFPF